MFYYPGERVSGKVYLRVHRQLDAFLLRLNFKGKEKSTFKCVISRVKQAESIENSKTYVYFDRKVNAFHFKETLRPGDYILPFEFHLPSILPASVLYQRQDEFAKPSMKIKYTIKAVLMARDLDVKFKHHLVVHEKPLSLVKTKQLNQTVHLSTCSFCVKVNQKECPCCFAQTAGLTNFAVTFQKNVFYPNESTNVLIKIYNS